MDTGTKRLEKGKEIAQALAAIKNVAFRNEMYRTGHAIDLVEEMIARDLDPKYDRNGGSQSNIRLHLGWLRGFVEKDGKSK